MKKFFAVFIILLFVATPIAFADGDLASSENTDALTERGKVVEIVTDVDLDELYASESTSFDMASQLVKVKVTTGKYKNEIFLVENNLSGNRAFDIVVEKGSNVILSIQETPEGVPNVYIADFVRDTYLYIILALFAILLIVIGKMKGLKSLITLSVTAFVVLKVMLPLFLKGYNPIWVTVLSAFFITVITFVIIGGLNIKSISAIIGTLGGVLIAGTLAYVIGKTARLTGLSSEEAHMLMFIPQNIDFNFQGLLFAGIIIGALGAVMDVAMSVASSMFEIREINPDISPTELMKSGMNVGKDIMGTMSNTLILAYTGSSIPLILVFMAYEASLVKILNLDLMATEIIRSIVGSIGLIITIPITSLATGLILKYKDSL
ncbi:YibE/F family protein [Sporosalibacterium faouarense]|uniref:YibE/F family protein n=1 Tax=Sporosalibacterium faouarense TaxID=516123 RepID=UPI00192CE265|nr:YibE/F family protein [Sporosalibacterium faouarense]